METDIISDVLLFLMGGAAGFAICVSLLYKTNSTETSNTWSKPKMTSSKGMETAGDCRSVKEIFDSARREVGDEGVFSPDQIARLFCMVDEIQNALKAAGDLRGLAGRKCDDV